jgi:hypothetical protein
VVIRRLAAAAASACAATTALGGCTLITDSFLTNDFSGDAFPTHVDTQTGAIVVGLRPASAPSDETSDAVLDLLSPITVIDSGPMSRPEVRYGDLLLLGNAQPGSGDRVVRARFPDAQLVALHPCADVDDRGLPNLDCRIGVPAGAGGPDRSRVFRGIVGADVLAGDAVRLRLGSDEIFVLADIGGNDRSRGLACDAVFGSPYRGGGTLVIAGTELPFGNRRITLQACLGPDADQDPLLAPTDQAAHKTPFPEPDPVNACDRERARSEIASSFQQRGTDALFVVSTSIGISILGAAAYDRYVLGHPGTPSRDQLPSGSVLLPSGAVSGGLATIERLALVGAASSNALAPCRQLYAHRLLSALGEIDPAELDRCLGSDGQPIYRFAAPCKDRTSFCPVPSILELTRPTGIAVLVVADTDPTLQALRAELRPDQPEVDGILGTDALRSVELDVDYPHDRVLARCPGADCIVRPPLAQKEDRCQINGCIKRHAAFRGQLPPGTTQDTILPGCPPPKADEEP